MGTTLVHLPSRSAVLTYAKSEVNLLWSSILGAKSTETFFCLTSGQKNILLQLHALLCQQENQRELEEAFRSAVYSIYMPEDTMSIVTDSFKSPVAVFQALLLSSKAKAFIDIISMDTKLNPLQFMMQLRGFSHLLESNGKGQEKEGSGHSKYVLYC